nr:F0F1 ATP synthase subunit delta [Solirubrobacterales bacterium]
MPVAERIYARALFDAAKDHDRLQPVADDLGDFVASVREVPEL